MPSELPPPSGEAPGNAASSASFTRIPLWWDLAALLRYRAVIADLSPTALPTLSLIAPQSSARQPRMLALLPGSFNPVTRAHLALAEAALAIPTCDTVWFLISVRTIDKEQVTGALLEDRLAQLCELARSRPWMGVAVCNRGLYVEQAEAARNCAGARASLRFLVGFDKIVQIFDPRYYGDRDEALQRLFGLASFLVAMRGDATDSDLDALLDLPSNRPFATSVRPFLASTSDRLAISSTRVRAAIAAGDLPLADLPAEVVRFIRETGAYAASAATDADKTARYTLRAALITALAKSQVDAERVDLQLAVAHISAGDAGAGAVATWLADVAPSARRPNEEAGGRESGDG